MNKEKKNKKEKKFNITWIIPKSKRLKLIKYINETPKEIIMARAKAAAERWFDFEVVGIENVPKEGRVLGAMNHLSLFDPMVLVDIPRESIFIAGSKLWKDPVIAAVLDKFNCIKVHIKNPGTDFYKAVRKTLNNEYMVVIYPEGTRMGLLKKIKYLLKKLVGKEVKEVNDGIGTFAVRSESPVLPIFILYKYKFFGLMIPHITRVKVVIGKTFMYEGPEAIKGSGQVAIDKIKCLKQQAVELMKEKSKMKALKIRTSKRRIYE